MCKKKDLCCYINKIYLWFYEMVFVPVPQQIFVYSPIRNDQVKWNSHFCARYQDDQQSTALLIQHLLTVQQYKWKHHEFQLLAENHFPVMCL